MHGMRSDYSSQQCRFHTYYGHGNNAEEQLVDSYSPDDDWDDIEQRSSEEPHWLEGMKREEYHSSSSLELNTALKVAHTYSRLYLCDDCHPLHITPRRPRKPETSRHRRMYVEELIDRESVSLKLRCQCSTYTRLVEVWRCIPCVLAKKADLEASRHQYWADVSRKAGFEKVSLAIDSNTLLTSPVEHARLTNDTRGCFAVVGR